MLGAVTKLFVQVAVLRFCCAGHIMSSVSFVPVGGSTGLSPSSSLGGLSSQGHTGLCPSQTLLSLQVKQSPSFSAGDPAALGPAIHTGAQMEKSLSTLVVPPCRQTARMVAACPSPFQFLTQICRVML